MIRDAAGIAALLEATPALRHPLEAVAALGLPDAWIGAGFIRNAVWDALCGLPFGSNPPGDVDVAWFGPMRLDPAGVEVAAPWGLADLLGRVIRPTPGFAADPAKRAVFERRLAEKRWSRRWPGLVAQSCAGSDRR